MHPLDQISELICKGSYAYLCVTSGIPVIPKGVFEVLPQLVCCLLVGLVVGKVK